MPRIRDAIRDALSPGDKLFTPNRKPFLVEALGVDEITLQVGSYSASTVRIAFDAPPFRLTWLGTVMRRRLAGSKLKRLRAPLNGSFSTGMATGS